MALNMASNTLSTATIPSSQVSAKRSSSSELTVRRNRPLQVRCKRDTKLEAPKNLLLKRRDAIIGLTTLSTTGIAISSPGTAEENITKADIKRKIKEKLEMLMEKMGLLKRKEHDKEISPPIPPPSSKKENTPPLQPPPLPLPGPPQNRGKLVETTSL